jgi:hypothetical protein
MLKHELVNELKKFSNFHGMSEQEIIDLLNFQRDSPVKEGKRKESKEKREREIIQRNKRSFIRSQKKIVQNDNYP